MVRPLTRAALQVVHERSGWEQRRGGGAHHGGGDEVGRGFAEHAGGAELVLDVLLQPGLAYLKQTGAEKPIMDIMRESAAKNFAPLFRGTVPLMGHSLASAILGLVGQPRLQKYIQDELGSTGMLGKSATNLVASAVVRPAPPSLLPPRPLVHHLERSPRQRPHH